MENEMLLRIKQCGLDITPKILIVSAMMSNMLKQNLTSLIVAITSLLWFCTGHQVAPWCNWHHLWPASREGPWHWALPYPSCAIQNWEWNCSQVDLAFWSLAIPGDLHRCKYQMVTSIWSFLIKMNILLTLSLIADRTWHTKLLESFRPILTWSSETTVMETLLHVCLRTRWVLLTYDS